MTTRALFVFFALTLFASAHAATCSPKCGSGKYCSSWRGIWNECLTIPTPDPACSCAAVYQPVCCRVSKRRGWFFLWKGTFRASNPCQCRCRSGSVCSTPAPLPPPVRPPPLPPVTKPPTGVACTTQFEPVCCSIPGKSEPERTSNACVCTQQKRGDVEADGECPVVKPPTLPGCTREYVPVCCKVGTKAPQIAANKCVCTNPLGGTIIAKSECPPARKPPGGVTCTTQFEPVCCSIPGKTTPETASNACVCTTQKLGTVKAPGECATTHSPPSVR